MDASMPAEIAILTLPDASSSVAYGMYDLFKTAGRDTALIMDGRPGPELLHPRIVARAATPFIAANDVVLPGDTVLAHLAASGLSKYDMPEYYLQMEAFPLTASGKVLKRELIEWLKSGRIKPTPVRWVAPKGGT